MCCRSRRQIRCFLLEDYQTLLTGVSPNNSAGSFCHAGYGTSDPKQLQSCPLARPRPPAVLRARGVWSSTVHKVCASTLVLNMLKVSNTSCSLLYLACPYVVLGHQINVLLIRHEVIMTVQLIVLMSMRCVCWEWGMGWPKSGKPKILSLCESTAQQQPNCCVTSTVLNTDPKHSTIWAAVERSNSIPARPSTPAKLDAHTGLSWKGRENRLLNHS